MSYLKFLKIISVSVITATLLNPLSFASDIVHPSTLSNIKAYTLYDRINDVVVSDYNSTTPMGIASISKLMTAKLVYDSLAEGSVKLDDMVYISSKAQSQDGDGLRLRTGDYIKLDDLLHGMLICSSNDAATALAEYIGGTEANFVSLMNNEAAALGLSSANFVNPNGLTEYDANYRAYPEQNIMSNSDIDRLADILLTEYPQITEITELESWTFEAKHLTKSTTNVFLSSYSEIDGLKTGYTNFAGYCQIVSASIDDLPLDTSLFENIFGMTPISEYDTSREIFASVLGSSSKSRRTRTIRNILDYSKSSLSIFPVADTQIPLYIDENGYYSIVPKDNTSLLLPNGSDIEYQVFINPLWQFTRMMIDGMVVGKITYFSNDMSPVSTDLVVKTNNSNKSPETPLEAFNTINQRMLAFNDID